MQTDKLIHHLFSAYPQFLFSLLGLPPETADAYETYFSEEVKEPSFRIDGVLVPKTTAHPLLFVEVQFQKDVLFYHRVFAEIFMYLHQHQVEGKWKAVVLLQSKGIEPKRVAAFQHFFEQDLIEVRYLKSFLKSAPENVLAFDILRLITATQKQAVPIARKLLMTHRGEQKLSEVIETIVLYHFKTKTREEIQAMLDIGFDVKQTVFYQEAKAEGIEEGIEKGIEEGIEKGIEKGRMEFAQGLIELLTDRFGLLPPEIEACISGASFIELRSYYRKAWKVPTLDEVFVV